MAVQTPSAALFGGYLTGENGWGGGVNQNWMTIEILSVPFVNSASVAAPPSSPAVGDRYLIATGATGIWAGKSGHIALWFESSWWFFEPAKGWYIRVLDVERSMLYDGSAWSVYYDAIDSATMSAINAAIAAGVAVAAQAAQVAADKNTVANDKALAQTARNDAQSASASATSSASAASASASVSVAARNESAGFRDDAATSAQTAAYAGATATTKADVASSSAAAAATSAAAAAGSATSAGESAAVVAGLAASGGAGIIGFIQNLVGAITNTVLAKLRLRVDVEDFGAVGDGVSDDTAAFVAAIASGVKNIRLTKPNYRVTNTLGGTRQSIGIIGDAAGGFQSTINLDDASGTKDLFAFADGENTLNGYHFSNIAFTRTQIATAGALVSMSRCGAVKFTRCSFYGKDKVFNALKLFRTIDVSIINCNGSDTVGDMIDWSGNSSVDKSIDLVIEGGRFEGGSSSFINVSNFCEGLFIKSAILFNFGSKIVNITPNGGNTFTVGKIQNCDIDTSTNYGIYAESALNMILSDNWYSAVMRGIYLKNCTEITISGGINFASTTGVEIDSCIDVSLNGMAISASATGLKFSSATATPTRISISGNKIRNTATAIAWGATPPTSCTLVGNSFFLNSADFSGAEPTSNYVATGNNVSGTNLNYASQHKWFIGSTQYGDISASGIWSFGPSAADYARIFCSTGNVDFIATGASSAVSINIKAKGLASINGYLQGGADLAFQFLRGSGSAGDSYAEFRAGSTNIRWAAQGAVSNLDCQVVPKGTGVLASTGAISVTTTGKGLQVKEGSNAKQGVTSAMISGSVTVSNTSVTANSRILYSRGTAGGMLGNVSLTQSAGVGFTLTSSSATETSSFVYQIFEPA